MSTKLALLGQTVWDIHVGFANAIHNTEIVATTSTGQTYKLTGPDLWVTQENHDGVLEHFANYISELNDSIVVSVEFGYEFAARQAGKSAVASELTR